MSSIYAQLLLGAAGRLHLERQTAAFRSWGLDLHLARLLQLRLAW